MGRPSKEQLYNWELIKSTGLVSRDNELYTSFEYDLSSETKYQKPYKFCSECRRRSGQYKNARVKLPIRKEYYILSMLEDKMAFNYLTHMHMYRDYNLYENTNFKETYYPLSLIPIWIFWQALTEERFDELYDEYVYSPGFMCLNQIKDVITKEELDEIIYLATEDFTFDIMTVIKPYRYNMIQPYMMQGEVSKKAFVEIDFTKPIGDIEETIRGIKKQFDSDPNFIISPFEVAGHEVEAYMCSIEDCEIFKHKSPKTLEGKMADLLFIYDCKKVGLPEKYITEEITRYWKNIKNISTENFYSFDDYYKQAKLLIDDQEYKSFLLGVKSEITNTPY